MEQEQSNLWGAFSWSWINPVLDLFHRNLLSVVKLVIQVSLMVTNFHNDLNFLPFFPGEDPEPAATGESKATDDWGTPVGSKKFVAPTCTFGRQSHQAIPSYDNGGDTDTDSWGGGRGAGRGGGGASDNSSGDWGSTPTSGGGGRGGVRGGGHEQRDGDWDCSCGTSNFASRRQCFKCSEPKPGKCLNLIGYALCMEIIIDDLHLF